MTRAVPEGWQKAANNAVFSLIKGSVIKDVADRPEKGRIPYLLIDTFNGGTPIYVPIDKSVLCSHDDPVIVMDGSRSGLVLRGKSGALGSTLAAARPIHANQLAKDFLYYYLTSLYSALNQGKTAGAVPHVDRQRLMGLPIFLPPLPEQQKIAEILGGVDAAIAITRQVIEQTRTLKRALMQSLLTKGIPGRHMRFKNSPLGKMPQEWKVVSLSDVAIVQTGYAKNGKVKIDNPVKLPYLRVANVQDGYVDLTEMKEIEVPKDRVSRFLLQKGDVLFNEGGDADKLGRGCVWQGQIDPCIHQNHVFAVRCNSKIRPDFLAFQAASAHGKRFFLGSSKQTTNLASVNSSQLKKFPVAVPSIAEQDEILCLLANIDARLDAERNFTTFIERKRQALMSALLSGDVRVVNYQQPQKQRARAC